MINLAPIITAEMTNFSSKLVMLENEYHALDGQQNMVKNTEHNIERIRSELPEEILNFYDQLRCMNKLKGNR